jgi:zinc protease
VLDEMNKIKNDGPTDVDLNKVKETLIRDRETRLKENSFWLGSLQNLYLFGDKLLTLEEYKTVVNSFTAEDIKAIANKYLNTQSYVQVALTPAAK